MKIVPELLYRHKDVRKIMVDGLCCIVHKTIDTIDTNTDHYVASHVLSVVLKGELNIETYYENERFLVAKNQLVFIPKGRYMITDIIPKDDEFEAVFYFFDDEIIQQFLNSIRHTISSTFSPTLVLKYTDDIRIFTTSILKLYPKEAPREVTKLKLLELLYLIYHSEQKNNFLQILHSLSEKKKRSIKELMLENFDKPLSIEDYAFLSGRSVSSFNRDFRQQFGGPPKKWLIEKRLAKATQLLTSSNLTIQQIASEVGYENVSHFISIFGKNNGISPKQFLLQNRINRKV